MQTGVVDRPGMNELVHRGLGLGATRDRLGFRVGAHLEAVVPRWLVVVAVDRFRYGLVQNFSSTKYSIIWTWSEFGTK